MSLPLSLSLELSLSLTHMYIHTSYNQYTLRYILQAHTNTHTHTYTYVRTYTIIMSSQRPLVTASQARLDTILSHLSPTTATTTTTSPSPSPSPAAPCHTFIPSSTSASISTSDIKSSQTSSSPSSSPPSGHGHRVVRVFQNWAQIHSCTPRYVHEPKNASEIIEIVKSAVENGEKVKCFGAGHSPSDIAMCSNNDHMISLKHMDRILWVDQDTCQVRVQAGIRLHQLNSILPSHNMAMPNLGSIDEQHLAGALATATHGTGSKFGVLSTNVLAIRFIDGNANVWELTNTESDSKRQDIFKAALCNIGCLGVVTEFTFQCVRAFNLHEKRYSSTWNEIIPNLVARSEAADHVRFHWFPYTDHIVVTEMQHTDKEPTPPDQSMSTWMKDRVFGYHMFEGMLYGARCATDTIPAITMFYHGMMRSDPVERIAPSSQVFLMECLFKQYVNEWSIPAENAPQAMKELRELIHKHDLKVHFPIEIRFVREDDIWLSPAYGRYSCYIGIIMYRPYGADVPYRKYFHLFEQMMTKLGGRPHWAKAFETTPQQFRQMYPKFDDFARVREQLDPRGVFANDYVQRLFEL
jgi:L-gulonolactone oxidase